jgi:hypothetical protein
MKSHALTIQGFSSSNIQRGTVIASVGEGTPLVRYAESPHPVACDVLDTGLGVPEYELGQTVLFVTYPDNQEAGCILGVVRAASASDAPVRRKSLHLEVEQFVVNARAEASIQTEGARIRLTRGGDLEFLAHSLISRARRLQKFLAPILRLN